jgi:hypothetical protein
MITPLVCSDVLIQAELIAMNEALSKVGYNDRDVPRGGYHWMSTVRVALPSFTRMCVDVGNNGQPGLATELPERAKPKSLEDDHARVETMGIKIIVVHNAHHPASHVGITAVTHTQ